MFKMDDSKLKWLDVCFLFRSLSTDDIRIRLRAVSLSFRFSKGSTRARDACGHLRVSRVLLDGPRKRETARSLSQNCFQGSPLSSSLAMFILGTVRLLRPGGGGLRGYSFVKGLILGGQFWAGLLCKSCQTML